VYDDGVEEEDADEAEITALHSAYGAEVFKEIVDGLNPVFAYLEVRLTGTCQHAYSCVNSYEICELLQLFEPSLIEENDITAALLARLEVVLPFGARPVLMTELQRDLHLYVEAPAAFAIDQSDVGDFTAV
jgi:hypothetical protein